MDKKLLANLPVFDRIATMDRLDGDESLLKELLELFASDCGQQLKNINAAIEANDSAKIHQTAHAIKGALGNIGAMRAHRVALEIEKSGKSGTCDKQFLTLLEKEIADFMQQVK